jgi:hypothetical protein
MAAARADVCFHRNYALGALDSHGAASGCVPVNTRAIQVDPALADAVSASERLELAQLARPS